MAPAKNKIFKRTAQPSPQLTKEKKKIITRTRKSVSISNPTVEEENLIFQNRRKNSESVLI